MKLTAAEYRASTKAQKPSKFRNQPIVVDGIRYASKREAAGCIDLIDREKRGLIGGLELQKRFPILGPKGELITTYVADACFYDHEQDRFRVIDYKGFETKEFKIKKRLMRVLKGIEIEVVR